MKGDGERAVSGGLPEGDATVIGADLRHVRSWIFDLDETL